MKRRCPERRWPLGHCNMPIPLDVLERMWKSGQRGVDWYGGRIAEPRCTYCGTPALPSSQEPPA